VFFAAPFMNGTALLILMRLEFAWNLDEA